jgi:hypothetical protein
MSGADQKQFTDAVAKAKADQGFLGGTNYDDWTAALQACNRLAMLELLPALESMAPRDVIQLQTRRSVEESNWRTRREENLVCENCCLGSRDRRSRLAG